VRALLAILLATVLQRWRLALPPLRQEDRTAYVTLISTDGYANGTAALALSLSLAGCRRPLVVLVGPLVSDTTVARLVTLGLTVERLGEAALINAALVQRSKAEGYGHWINTFDKLSIFAMTQFEKIVFLDSDMMVLDCLDPLFSRPHLSAVVAGKSIPGNEQWTRLNSGTLVVEPSEAHAARVAAAMAALMTAEQASRGAIGDQDVINAAYPDWPYQTALHLSERFNVFGEHVDAYARLLRDEGGVAVVHFAGGRKPWQLSRIAVLRSVAWYFCRGQPRAALALLAYCGLIRGARRARLGAG
jgi:glycogenin glucosyltransferase